MFNLVIASVGGQGGLTLSRILADAAVRSGYSVRTAETLGMAQRGGSVQSFVRIGEVVRSPIFPLGTADALVGLEALEAVRASVYIKKGGLIMVDPIRKDTLTTLTKTEVYPPLEELMAELTRTGGHIYSVAASAESSSLGSPKSANVLMLGAFSTHFNLLSSSALEESIGRVLGSKGSSALHAFRRGLEMAQKDSLSP
jgi:indolepyruvate ferredoxin oxidoreductase beta subunit